MPLLQYEYGYLFDEQSGTWVAWVPFLGRLTTFGSTQPAATRNIKDAIHGLLEVIRGMAQPPWAGLEAFSPGGVPVEPTMTGSEVLRALDNGGFRHCHARGRHHYLRKAGQPMVVCVPAFGQQRLPGMVLYAVLQQARVTVEDLAHLAADC